MRVVSILLLIACFLITLALGAQNQEVVTFNFLIAKDDFTLSTLLGGVFACGFLLGWAVSGILYFKARYARKRLEKKLDKKQQELDKLRTAPTTEVSDQVVAAKD